MDGEIWKVIPNFEDYHCSNFGRVKSFKGGKIKILKPLLTAYAYLEINLCKDGKPKCFRIARLVAELFLENPLNKPEVNHLHGRWNNHVDCLEWATSSENNQHAYDTGLNHSGEEHFRAKLANEQIVYIRENPDNLTGRELAQKFGVGAMAISRVQRGKRWKSIGGTIRQARKMTYLSEKQREEIRNLRAEFGYSCRELAEMFTCGQTTISRIIREEA